MDDWIIAPAAALAGESRGLSARTNPSIQKSTIH
jgi:hypothetical protein